MLFLITLFFPSPPPPSFKFPYTQLLCFFSHCSTGRRNYRFFFSSCRVVHFPLPFVFSLFFPPSTQILWGNISPFFSSFFFLQQCEDLVYSQQNSGLRAFFNVSLFPLLESLFSLARRPQLFLLLRFGS